MIERGSPRATVTMLAVVAVMAMTALACGSSSDDGAASTRIPSQPNG